MIPDASRNRALPGIAVIAPLVVAAVLFRVLLLLAVPQPIRGTDAEQYLRLAENLRAGNGYSLWPSPPFEPDVYRSPGYPLFLAFLSATGSGPEGMIAAQVFLELAAALVGAAAIGRRGGSNAGGAAFAAACLCPFTASIPVLFLSESLALPLVTLIFAAAIGLGRGRAAVLGLLWGWLVLTRGGFLPGLALAAAACAWESGGGRHAVRSAAIFLFAAALVIAPYGAWNARHHGRFSVTPLAGFGRALWGGPQTMRSMGAPALPPGTWKIHEAIWGDGSFRPSPRELIAADRELGEAAKAAIAGKPGAWLAGVARHALHVWIGVRELFPLHNPPVPGWVLRVLSLAFLVGAGLGLRWLPASRPARFAALTPLVATAVTLPWLYVIMRYTTVLFGPLALLAGAWIGAVVSRRRG